MRRARVHTGVMRIGKAASWNYRHAATINHNKGIDLLPKRAKLPFIKRLKLWWTE